MTPDEIIATAMLLGAEFHNGGSGLTTRTGKVVTPYWRCAAADNMGTGFYIQKHDAASAFLRRRGYELDFNGELQKI